MKKLFLLLVAVLSVTLCASAQTRTVTGTVLEDGSEEPIIGASVTAGNSKLGVATDVDGAFRISVGPNVTRLHVSMTGYATKTVKIPASGKVTVYLESTVSELNEAVVIAYGTTTKAAYTGSASVIKSDQLENSLTSNVTNALSGKVSGVQTLSSNGQPGTSATVRIRGVGSINASTDPLYVIDGMPFDGDIATIPNSDIESLTVLKDAASTALYGARGANGVILITTKSGKEGSAKVTVDMRWGSNSRAIPQYDVITDQRQYLETVYQALKGTGKYFMSLDDAGAHRYATENLWKSLGYQTWTVPNGQDPVGTNGKFNPYATPGYVDGNYMYLTDDWTKETLIHGLRQEYNISITGGTNRLKYYLSGSYLGDEGIIKSSHFNRFSTRMNVDYQAKDWLTVGAKMSYTYTNSGYPGDQTLDYSTSVGNAFNLANNLGPFYPMYIRDPQGNIRYHEALGTPIYDYGDAKDYGWGRTPARNTYSSANPAGDLLYDRQDFLADVFDGLWYAKINPVTGLNITGTAGYHVDNTRLHYLKNPYYGSGTTYKGQASQQLDRYRTINLQLLAQYSRKFGVNDVDIMLGAENQSFNMEDFYGIGSNLYNPDSFVINNTIDQKNAGGYIHNLVHRGFFGRINYNFDGRYYASVSLRRDGSSRFAKNHRWGTFWSASAGWNINREAFMEQYAHNIDLLKLKFSFGQNGNDGIGYAYGTPYRWTAYTDVYGISGANGVWSDGDLKYKGNPDITWETSNSLNVGVDFSFWKGKFSGTVEYFQRQTSDMLFNVPVAPSLGYSSMPMNVGSMRNAGVEVDLNYTPINTKDITWDIFANITFGWNKVLKLDSRILNTNSQWQIDSKKGWLTGSRFFLEGESMYQSWMVKYAGMNEDGQAQYWALRDKVDPETGLKEVYKYKTDDSGNLVQAKDDNGEPMVDANGNPVYEVAQYVQEEYKTVDYSAAYNTNRRSTGNLMPKAYGGFGTSLSAYGVELSLQFAYQFGGKIFDSTYQGLMDPGSTSSLGQAWHKDILNAWTPENTNTDVPRLQSESKYNAANSTSDRFLISSNYLSLNNITLGYTLPAKWTNKIKVSDVKLYFVAEGVALWSKRKGLDPRQGYVSSDNSTYSPIRTFSGGVKFSF